MKTMLVAILIVLVIAASLAILDGPDLEVFGGPVATATVESRWLHVIDFDSDWTFTLGEIGPNDTITIAEPFARAMRDAIGRLE